MHELTIIKTRALLNSLPERGVGLQLKFRSILTEHRGVFIAKGRIIEELWGCEENEPLTAEKILDVFATWARHDGMKIEVRKRFGMRRV